MKDTIETEEVERGPVDAKHLLTIQTILYGTNPSRFLHSMTALKRSVEMAVHEGLLERVYINIGDCSPTPVLSTEDVDQLSALFDDVWGLVTVEWFDENLGHGGGHNRLFHHLQTELCIVLNPDTHLAPTALTSMLRSLGPGVGIVEARQIPMEHPKDYDPRTGDTTWASGACFLTTLDVIKRIEGFDHKSFFLYGDDVDFSWRTRLAGYRVIFDPAARVFHDKRLNVHGAMEVSEAEIYYSAECALLLAHKYSRPDLVDKLLEEFAASPSEAHQQAREEYLRRQEALQLPTPLDPEKKVAQFTGGTYGAHRF